MKYTRTLEVECENCGAIEAIRDGDPIEKYWRGRLIVDEDAVAGENGQPVPLTVGVLAVLRRGWVAVTPRDVDGTWTTHRSGAKLESMPRGLMVVCSECAPSFVPPLSRAAQRVLDEAAESERALIARVIRLEGQVAALTGLAETVAS